MLLRSSLLAVCLAATACQTSDEAGGRWSLSLDNDTFTGSDNNYTNGLGIGWASPERDQLDDDGLLAGWIDAFGWLPMMDAEGAQTFASFVLGQEVYTANDIKDPDPPLDEQPYAGLLFLDAGLHTLVDDQRVDWSVRVGMVGPSSGAEDIQREVHELIGVNQPQGWDTQLPDEPFLNLDAALSRELVRDSLSEDLEWRMGVAGSASLGTYYTGLGSELYTEIGWNLPEGIGTYGLRGGPPAVSSVGPLPNGNYRFSVFTSLNGYLVGHYLPLDGTVFQDSRSVDSHPFVGAVRTGLAMRYDRLLVRFTVTHASESFDGQKEDTEFGTFSFLWIP